MRKIFTGICSDTLFMLNDLKVLLSNFSSYLLSPSIGRVLVWLAAGML